MRILLADVGTPRDEISEPLGIETLASYIPEQDYVDMVSLELQNYQSVGAVLDNYNIIGLSTKIRAFERFEKSMADIEEASPNSVVLVGDILGTYAFDEVLKRYDNVICIRGEGEEAFPLLIERVREGRMDAEGLADIPNLAFISNREIVTTERKGFDVSKALRPSRVLTGEVYRQNGCSRMEASRGCAYSACSYCGGVEKYAGPGWKPFSVDFILGEMEMLSGMGFRSPWLTDEDFFGTSPERAEEIAEAVLEFKEQGRIAPEVDFYINARADSILGADFGGPEESRKILLELKAAGLREIFLGVESGCKRQLERYGKSGIGSKSIAALQLLGEIGIETDLGFIFFDRDATMEDLKDNLAFIYEAGIDKHDARLVKRIRIEPRTPMGVSFRKGNPDAPVDLNLVEYEYEFTHPEVGQIYREFEAWESGDLDVIYNLQSFCRGEIPEGYERADIKTIISRYRTLDLKFLKELLKAFESGTPSDSYMKELRRDFDERRDVLDSTQINRIKWLDSNFRRNLKPRGG